MKIRYRFCCGDMEVWFADMFIFDSRGLLFLADPRMPMPNFCPFCGEAITVDELDSEEVEDNNASQD